jgi:hypothetical protein
MQPGGPGPTFVNVAVPKAVAVKHDPQSSKVERLRAEEAALDAITQTEPPSVKETAYMPLSAPEADEPSAAEPMSVSTPLTSASIEEEAARAM